jgi:hypothetical protein
VSLDKHHESIPQQIYILKAGDCQSAGNKEPKAAYSLALGEQYQETGANSGGLTADKF